MNKVIDFATMSPSMTRELNHIAEKYRKPYTEWIDELAEIYDDDTGFWWDTPLASRNVYLSWCFLDICMLRLILNYVTKYDLNEIVVSCDEIKRAVLHNTKGLVVHAPERGDRGIEYHKRQSDLVFRKFQEMIKGMQHYRRTESLDAFRGRNLTLVGTYRIAAETQTGMLQDRCFTGLKENTDEDIVFLSLFGVFQKGEEQLLDVIHDRDDHICIEDWIKEQDLQEIQRYIHWSQSVNVRPCIFDGMDVTLLVEAAFRAGGWSINAMHGVARGEALCRIVEQYELKIKSLIDWYEGQSSSNAMIRRFRKKYPKVPTVACSPFPYPENNLGLYPSSTQIENKIVPEYFSVMGKAWKGQIRQFTKKVKCIIAPSFRHMKIFETETELPVEKKGVLLILPIFVDCSTQMLTAFGEALQGMDVDNIGPIYIKSHPVNQNMRLSDYGVADDLYQNCNVSYLTCNMNEALRGKKAVVLSKTTSTLETMLSGVYTINYIPTGDLSMLALPEEARLKITIAYTVEDLRSCLQTHTKGFTTEEIKQLRENALTRVNRETIDDFLMLRKI